MTSFRFGFFLFFLVPVAWAAEVPAVMTGPLAVQPTVVVAQGDPGGTFFGRVPPPEKTRRYYVAAESELWDFAPSGRDELCGTALPPTVGRNRKSGKVRYVQYTDETFRTRALPNRSLGILGPALRGVVGEYLAVTFLNRTDQPLSLHPHGVKYDKDSEGAYHLPNPGRGAAVGPGARFTYVWHLDEASGPMRDEPSSKAWLYHSHVSPNEETNLGLIGAIIVTDPQRARSDGTPRDVDREFATLFLIFDESGFDEAALEAAEYGGLPGLTSEAPLPSWSELQQQREQGARYAINGMVFGNLPGLQMNEGERTRWYLLALGSEQDFHTAHWHGLRAIEEGRRRTDVIDLLPATMKVADVVADNPGTWLYHCHVAEHMREGMFARVTVHGRDTVGVSRAPADAFLGYASGADSLQIHAAEVRRRGETRELFIRGAVTVYDGFAVFNEPLRVTIQNRTLEFQPNQAGVAERAEGSLRVLNANEFGVVRGGILEFELALREDSAGGSAAVGAAAGTLMISIDVAKGHHVARHAIAPLAAAR